MCNLTDCGLVCKIEKPERGRGQGCPVPARPVFKEEVLCGILWSAS